MANCWIPLPDGATDVSTKAIHHHGTMLLTTVTAFGPGYEHWTFTTPELVDAERDLFSMRTIDHGAHGLGDAAFVDARIAHVPLYTSATTITLHPSADGFVGMRDRKEFPLGPNTDYLASLFHVLQVTGNDELGPVIEEAAGRCGVEDRAALLKLVAELRRGEPIEPRLSPGHTGVPFANFTRADIQRALAVSSI